MSERIKTEVCPMCGVGSHLSIEMKFMMSNESRALIGSSMKVPVSEAPHLMCGNCSLCIPGRVEYENGEPYAVFDLSNATRAQRATETI